MSGGGDAAHHVTVLEVTDLGPGMRRVRFGGDLDGWRSTGSPDEYVRLLFPAAGQDRPVLPTFTDGVLDYSSVDLALLRTYTVRAVDAARPSFDVDFVVHEGGVAATWARQAEPGQVIGVNRPTAVYDAPDGLEWQVLASDLAGLPALCRILEVTRPEVRNRVVVEVADDAHRIELPAHPRTDVTWCVGGNGRGPSRLPDAVRSLPRPEGVGYTWVAGETRALRAVRAHLRKTLRLPATSYKTVGYWVENAEQWDATYDALPDDVRARLESMWESDRDPEEIADEYDEMATKLGL